jgi:hypothetical protein
VPSSETVRDVLIGGGFFTGLAAIVAALISSGDAQHSRTLQSYEQARVIASQQYSQALATRQQMCSAALSYIEDDKPNSSLTETQKRIAFDAVAQGLQHCGLALPPPPQVINPSESGSMTTPVDAQTRPKQGESK